MKINELNPKQKITIISLGFIFIILFISLFFFIKPANKYGADIGINNYDKYISNLPADRRDSLNSSLYNLVKYNSKSGKSNINDATVRGDSVEYNYNKTTNINSGSFIVDIPSIKQSYLLSYRWSSDNSNVNLGGYTATAACVPSKKLIYSNFDCKDSFANSPDITSSDPILSHLPYSTFNYTVTGKYNDNNKLDLNVNIILYSSDTRDGQRDNSISKYKSQVIDWIKSINLNPDNYLINYIIHG